MLTGNYVLQVQNPCNQAWDNMVQNHQGRFCANCSKTVHDFTLLTDAQILHLLSTQKGEICGRLNAHQTNRPLQMPPVNKRANKLREIFGALLLLLTTQHAPASQPPAQFNSFVMADNKNLPDVADTSKPTTLTGRVINSKGNAPVADVIVENETKNIMVAASNAGRFKIDADIGDIINITCLGYQPAKIVVADLDFKDYKLEKSPPMPCVPTMGAVMYVPAK